MGIMDYIAKTGADLLTPPQASPVFQSQTPLQQSMGRPQVQFSQPSAATMATTMPSGMMTMASPTPQVQQQFAPRSTGMPTPPQVTPRIGGTDMGGAGVRMTQEQLAEQAAKAVKIEQERPEIAAQPGFQNTVKEFFGDRENMLRLALAFNSMTLRPDTGLASVIGQELQDIRETRAGETQRSRTAEYFDKEDPRIASAIRAGLDPKSAITLYRDKKKGVVVGKMIVNPTTGAVIYDGSKEGSDLPDSVQKLIFQAKEANLQPGTPEYREFMARGGKSKGLSMRMNADGTFEFSETGDLPNLTEGQGKATLFGTRMSEAQQIINTVENEGTSIYNAIVGNVPFVGNLATSNEFKIYDQAKQDFINAILRFESGAAIGQNEFDRADTQYFPQPGDTPEVIANKRKNRDIAIAAMSAVSGPAAKEYSDRIRQDLFGDRAKDFPKVGTVEDGFRYLGGDPSIETNWVKVQ
tara:strand:+ start:3971 stop:5371 length:1401 start_codon:yes stop_codon:yes gene_type:complete